MSLLGDLGGLTLGAAGAATGNGLLLAGSAASLAAGGGDSGSGSTGPSINSILQKALQQAVSTNNAYTGQAVNAVQTGANNAVSTLANANTAAQNSATSNMANGLQTYQTLQQPFATQGYNASDALSQTLGLATPQGGSAALVQNTQLAQQLQPLLQSLNGNYNLQNAGAAPTAYQNQGVGNFLTQAAQQGATMNGQQLAGEYQYGIDNMGMKASNFNSAGALTDVIATQLANNANQTGQANYQNQLSQYNNTVSQDASTNATINQLGQLLQGGNTQQLAALLKSSGL